MPVNDFVGKIAQGYGQLGLASPLIQREAENGMIFDGIRETRE
jgi:hypothetical protein